MICERCAKPIEPGEERELHGQHLCEDCYMDMMFPTRPCDPWATMSAKNVSQLSGEEECLTERQEYILGILQQGPVSLEELAEKSGMDPSELERDLFTLHHMERVGAIRVDGEKIFRLWAPNEGESHDAV